MIKKYRELIPWIIIAVMIYVPFAKPCGRERVNHTAAIEKENRDLKKKHDQDSVDMLRKTKDFNNRLIALNAQKAISDARVQVAEGKVITSQQTINRLLSKIDKSKNDHPDSAFVLVHPGYVEGCDSLATVVRNQQQQISDYMGEIDGATELLNYEVILRDGIIESEKNYNIKLRADFNTQAALLKNALSVGKPRGRFLAGAGILGNKTNPLTGAKIVMAYQSKGGKQYQAGASIVHNELLYEGSVLITLFK